MANTLALLIEALKEAMAHEAPQPLYKSGKQAGLFASRAGGAGEAAQQALRDGLIEVVRKEAKGKSDIEFVRITPIGVQFVHQHESPRAVLEELAQALRVNQANLPRWLEEVRAQVHALSQRFTQLLDRQQRHFDQLVERVEAALNRLRANPTGLPLTAWQMAGLEYARQRNSAAAVPCPLPELFNALRQHHPELSLGVFHEGLAELRDRGAIELVPFAGHLSELAEPEYALLEGSAVYSAVRIPRGES